MFVCENCFNDEEIQTSICNFNQIGSCDICGANDTWVTDLTELSPFFLELLHLFKKDNEGMDIVSKIQYDWDIFSNKDVARKILESLIQESELCFGINDKVSYAQSVNKYVDKWEELKHEIRTKTRFYSSLMSYFDDNGNLLKSNNTLNTGMIFYRARIVPAGKTYLTKKEMGCPPTSLASPGRANPIGIPYLYLCRMPKTTLYETRSVYLDKVAVGKFKLTSDVNILDFTASISLFLAYNGDTSLSETIAQHRLRQKISADLSKPLRRYDTELEYVPTQSICEYCKIKGIDGIIFRSSLHKGGLNLVLFDEQLAECVSVKTVEIAEVIISAPDIE